MKSDGAGPTSVLIVDDDEEVRHVLRLLCETEGLEVLGEAANSAEAVQIALKRQPDLVILDYKLPTLDGQRAAEIFRSLCPDSKIVAFSAALDSTPEWADAFLNKQRVAEMVPLLHALLP